jgi:hypothetical protein
MSYQFGQRPSGIETTKTGIKVPYRLIGEQNAFTARTYALAQIPLVLGAWYRTDVRMSQTNLAGGVWDIDAEFGPADKKEPASGDHKWSFDTTGATKHITQAIEHIDTYVASGATEIDHKGAIGVTDDAVEGVDVPDRAFKWSETWQLALAAYGFAFSTVLGDLTGRVNNTYFRGFPAYTVRFDGATGSQSPQDSAIIEITYNFAVSPSETGLVIGDITGIAKTGWDYLWVRYETADDATAKKTTPKPRQVEVDRVLTAFNFGLLGIGTGVLA